ncbi:GNAT family N-acetyltransferase [Bombilactobacillus folatiphilus]|uniref:GNAT family N-acetyltransferase n=1 Tax=Bombilactobacillus folatiphilus TaxID=2923362 RepID=A0ABY4P816_9LACO|nr:GNAT family N-acetyltransferase [Bombilactobacillus folatiphilus]UQS81843.1 GNAT family N-acetyltransferase [Bombilactobacillus folatiphilus]
MKIKTTTNIQSKIYNDSLNLRTEVFVDEQQVPTEREIDQDEANCRYYVGYRDSLPVVTARVLPETPVQWHIQRVAVKKRYRHQGLASQIMKEIEEHAKLEEIKNLVLNAQDQAQNFYKTLGYKVRGEQFLDAGIEHHQMIKKLKN